MEVLVLSAVVYDVAVGCSWEPMTIESSDISSYTKCERLVRCVCVDRTKRIELSRGRWSSCRGSCSVVRTIPARNRKQLTFDGQALLRSNLY